MRVLYLTSGWTPHDARFIRSICRRGISVDYWGYDAAALPELPAGVPGFHGPQPPDASDYDLLHAGPLDLPLAQIRKLLSIPMLSMCWAREVFLYAPRNAQVASTILSSVAACQALFVDSSAVLEALREMEAQLPKTILNLPWGLEWESFEPLPRAKADKLRRQLGLDGTTALICTRPWHPDYGTQNVVEAFVRASRKNNRLRLLLGNEGPLQEQIERRIREEGLSERVFLLGRFSEREMAAFYCAADFYVSASLSDGTSVSLLEAMACEKPVIVNDIPGNREWVVNGENGWLIDTSNINALSKLFEGLDGISVQSLQRIGRTNRETVFSRADWDKNFDQVVQTYRALVKESA